MPISDEIIELEPVKKTKSKLIIMFVIMGVLLALAITFLVLYFLKPNVQENTSKVIGLQHESSSLFTAGTDEEGNAIQYASVSNEYTVYVDVSVEGDAASEVSWAVEPSGALIETGKGHTEGYANRFYYTFRPNTTYANGTTPITITARSTSDPNQRTQIVLYVLKQGTETIQLSEYWREGGTHKSMSESLELPYYEVDSNNQSYYVTFNQLGAYNSVTDTYSGITVENGTQDGKKTNDVEVVSSNPSVIEVYSDVNVTSNPARFRFRVRSSGTATITITANKYNDFADAVVKTINISTASSAQLGYIDSIFVTNMPISESYYNGNPGKITQVNALTLTYNESYTDILKHILLRPQSLQYDQATKKLKTDWYSMIDVKSSDSSIVSVTSIGNDVSLRPQTLSGEGACKLIISDKSSNSVGAKVEIAINVVAQNSNGDLSIVSGGKTYGDSAITDLIEKESGVPTSPSLTSEVSITYVLMAPAATDIDSIMSHGLISSAFVLTFDSSKISVKLGSIAIESGKTYNFSSTTMSITKPVASGSRFNGVAKFSVTVLEGVQNGVYSMTYQKLGVAYSDKYSLTNPSWQKRFAFDVTSIATTAGFVTDEQADALVRSDGTGGVCAGDFNVIKTPEKGADNIYRGSASIHVQNRNGMLPFDITKLVTKNGEGEVSFTLNSAQNTLKMDNGNLVLTGKIPSNYAISQGTVIITAKNNNSVTIGIFTVNVYILDAISVLSCDTTPLSFNYTSTYGECAFDRDTVKAQRTFDSVGGQYTYTKSSISISYEQGGNRKFLERSTGDGGIQVFKLAGVDTPIFNYNTNLGRFTLATDIFEFSYNNNVDLSSITIIYTMSEDDPHVGALLSCERSYTFIRIADSVGLYSDDAYTRKIDKVAGSDSKVFEYSVNQGSTGYIYTSAIISINNGTQVVTRAAAGKTIAAVEEVYITVPDVLDSGRGSVCSSSDNAYYSIIFTAPVIIGDEESYGTQIKGAGDGYTCNVVVQNYARPIQSIGIYSSADCDENQSLTSLVFGKYGKVNNNPNEKTIYIKVMYAPNEDKYTLFEPAKITMPYAANDRCYFDIALLSEAYGNAKTLTLTSPFDKNKNDCIYAVKVRLNYNNAVNIDDCTIFVQETYYSSVNPQISSELSVAIDTGLKDISYKVGDSDIDYNTSSSNTVDVGFELNAANEQKAIDIQLTYNGLSTAEYGGVKYNTSHLSVSVTVVDGLKCEYSLSTGLLRIIVDNSKLKNLNHQLVTFTFTDSALNAAAKFVIKFNVTVKCNIFSINMPESASAETTGANSGTQTAEVIPTYNNGTLQIAPAVEYLGRVVATIVTKTGENTYAAYSGNDIFVSNADSNGKFVITVNNSVLSGMKNAAQSIYLKVSYTSSEGTINQFMPVIITTTSLDIGIGTVSGNVAYSDGTATVKINTVNDEFSIPATAANRGSGEIANAQAITYKLYSDSDYSNEITGSGAVATISASGVIKFLKPSTSGVVYYLASFTDVSSSEVRELKIPVNYTLSPTAVELDGLTDIMSGSTVTMYYLDQNNYTTLNLENYIKVHTAFDGTSAYSLTINVVSNDTDSLTATGYLLTPKKAAETSVTITAISANGVSVTKDYTVKIISLADAVILPISSGDINIAETDTTTFTHTVKTYTGLVLKYTVSSTGVISVINNDMTNTITVNRASVTAGDYKDHAVSSKASYSSSVLNVVGELSVTKNYMLTVKGEYVPTFEFKKTSNGTTTVIGNGSQTTMVDGDTYSVVLTNGKIADSAWKYSASDTNGVAEIKAFAGDTAALTLKGSGTVIITVTAIAYNKSYTASASYTFTQGGSVSSSAEYSSDGTTYTGIVFDDNNVATQAIDFSTDCYKIKYVIDVSKVGTTVSASNIEVYYTGDVSPYALTTDDNGKTYYMTFDVAKSTRFTVSAVVLVGGRYYYTDKHTINLTATEPIFVHNATASKILPGASTTLSITQTAAEFKGNYTAEYALVTGSSYASLSNGTITAQTRIAATQAVVVRATITVTDGVYSGNVYTVDKTIIIEGVALPTISWTDEKIEVALNAGDNSVDLAARTSYTKADNDTGVASYSFNVTAANGLSVNTDYKIDGNSLKIFRNDTTRAGGLIKVTCTATISDGVNAGASITTNELQIVIIPQAKSVSNSGVMGKAGDYTLSGLAALYTNDADGFVRPSDSYTITYSLPNSVTNVSVSGDRLTLAANFATKTTVNLTATIVITTGVYAGRSISCATSITINGLPAGTANATWVSGSNAYGEVSLQTSINTSAYSGASVANIQVLSMTGGISSVTNNNTINAAIAIDKDANVEGSAYATPSITVSYVVTLSSGAQCYGETTISIEQITPDVKIMSEGVEYADGDTITITAGSSLRLLVSEANGLSVEALAITDIAGVEATIGTDFIVLTALAVTQPITQGATIRITVSNVQKTFEFTIVVNPAIADGTFTYSDEIYTLARTAYNNQGYSYPVLTIGSVSNDIYIKSISVVSSRYSYDRSMYEALIDNSALSNVTVRNKNGEITNASSITNAYNNANSATFSAPVQLSTLNVKLKLNTYIEGYYDGRESRTYTATIRLTLCDASGSNTYNSSKTINVTIAPTVSVSFNSLGGSDVTSVTGIANGSHVARPGDPTKNGYLFRNWYTDAACTAEYDFNTSVDHSFTLYAGWTSAGVRVVLDPNYLGSNTSENTVSFGEAYGTVLNSIPTRTGYTFDGWYTSASGGSKVQSSDLVTQSIRHTLYAHWRANTVAVTFDANNGSIDSLASSKTVTFDSPYGTLPVATRTGYSFAGWYTNRNNGSRINSITLVSNASGHTLYARWQANEYSVTLDANGGSVSSSSVDVTYGSAYGTLPTPTRTGYAFNGWYTLPNGGTKIESGTNVTIVQDITLYAQWSANVCVVTLDANGGIVSGSPVNVTYSSTYGTLPTPTLAGHSFVGWFTGKTQGVQVLPDSVVTLTENTATLYAHWIVNTYSLTLDGNNGTIAGLNTLTVSVTYGGTFSILNLVPTRTAHSFDGWYTAIDGGTKVNPDDIVGELSAGYTLYAHWQANTYSVTLNANGGSVEGSSVEVTYGSTYGTLPTPTLAGHSFDGWYTAINGGTKVNSSDIVGELSAGYTLYAHWQANTYSVTLNANGGSVEGSPVSVTYGSTYGTLPTPTLAEHAFVGWYTAIDGGTMVNPDDIVGELVEGYTLYAHWAAN